MASATEALSDAVLAIAAEHAVEPVLQKLVDAARELAGARYAAIGVPDGDGGFGRFITSGMSDALIASLGELPRTHGLLGAMLESAEPYRTQDIRQDPRFRGWWPRAHPSMASFLGVPIVSRGAIVGAFYLTEKEGAVLRRRRGAHRDVRRARGAGARERPPARAQPRAQHRRGAQPPRS